MSDSANVSVVRRLYQARGNPEVIRQVLATDVRWEVVDGFPYGAVYVGRGSVLRDFFGRLFTDFDEFVANGSEFFESGERVIALGSYSGRVRRTGKRFSARFAHVGTLQDGLIVRSLAAVCRYRSACSRPGRLERNHAVPRIEEARVGSPPPRRRARADVTRWQFWDSSHFSPQLGTLTFQRVLKPMIGMGEPDAGKVEEALTNFRRFAAVLNKRLDGKQYIVGDSMTLADLTLASSLMYAKQAEVPLAEFPNIQAWFSRISDMDAWTKTNP